MQFIIFFEDIIKIHISPDRCSINDGNSIRYLNNVLNYDLISRKTDGKCHLGTEVNNRHCVQDPPFHHPQKIRNKSPLPPKPSPPQTNERTKENEQTELFCVSLVFFFVLVKKNVLVVKKWRLNLQYTFHYIVFHRYTCTYL